MHLLLPSLTPNDGNDRRWIVGVQPYTLRLKKLRSQQTKTLSIFRWWWVTEQTKKDTASIWLYLVNIYFLLLALRCSTRGFRASGAKLFFFSCCLCSRHSQTRNTSILAISQFCRIVNPPFFFRRMCKNRCHRTRRLFPSFAYLGRSINAVGGKKIISSLLK
jgi:hypothetical protein